MAFEKELENLYQQETTHKFHMYARPLLILLCCLAGFYGFRVIIMDYILETKNQPNIYNAIDRIEEGNFQEAEVILKQILAKQPNYSIANKQLGFIYLQQDRLEEALECYQKAKLYYPEPRKIDIVIELINKRINEEK